MLLFVFFIEIGTVTYCTCCYVAQSGGGLFLKYFTIFNWSRKKLYTIFLQERHIFNPQKGYAMHVGTNRGKAFDSLVDESLLVPIATVLGSFFIYGF